jgi:hypothetical protein
LLDKPQQLIETGEYCTRPFRDPPPSRAISDGDDREDASSQRYRKQPLFIVVESLDVPAEHTHILSAASILPKETRG